MIESKKVEIQQSISSLRLAYLRVTKLFIIWENKNIYTDKIICLYLMW